MMDSPQQLDHPHYTAVPTSGLPHSTDFILWCCCFGPVCLALLDSAGAQLRLISLPVQSQFLAEFAGFWRCAMDQMCLLPGAAFSEGQEGQQQERYRVLSAAVPEASRVEEMEQNNALLS